jgi:hypothetical protein
MAQVPDKELLKYWEQLDTPQKKSILGMIKSFLQPSEKHSHITIEQYNKELDDAMGRIDSGKFVTHEVVLKRAKNW